MKKSEIKKEDSDRNIFNELSRCVQEQKSNRKEASPEESNVFSGRVHFTRREYSRPTLENDYKQSWK